MSKKEEWRPIHEGSDYFVSNKGQVMGPRGIIKPQPNKVTGLIQCMAYVDNKPKLLNVQQWVAKLFLGEKPFPDAVARHKSKNLTDNRVENLYWGKNGANSPKQDRFRYVIKQKTVHGLVLATYIGWKLLANKGFKRASITAAAHGKYRGGNYIYKQFMWEVIRLKNVNEGNGVQE